MPKKYREVECTVCGKVFKSAGTHAKFCPECRPGMIAETRREYNAICRSKKKAEKKRTTVKTQSITEAMRELETYNEKHGTYYSYGQYMLLKFNGRA